MTSARDMLNVRGYAAARLANQIRPGDRLMLGMQAIEIDYATLVRLETRKPADTIPTPSANTSVLAAASQSEAR